MSLNNRLNLIYSVLLLSFFVIVSQLSLVVVHRIWDTQLPWSILQFCINAIKEVSKFHISAILIAGMFILYTFGRMLWCLIRQLYLAENWLRYFHNNQHDYFTSDLNTKYEHLKTRIIVVRDAKFIALAVGFFRPKIIVSTGLLTMFSDREVEAILLHEWYHCRKRDPLRLFLLTVIVEGMGYIPRIKDLVQEFKMGKELLADRFVIREMGTEYYLGNVLFKLASIGSVAQPQTGVSFAETAINYRILQVLQPEQYIQAPVANIRPTFLFFVLLVLASSFLLSGCL